MLQNEFGAGLLPDETRMILEGITLKIMRVLDEVKRSPQ